jgi:hypothetical protein
MSKIINAMANEDYTITIEFDESQFLGKKKWK